jgi:hypothetical protein
VERAAAMASKQAISTALRGMRHTIANHHGGLRLD